MPTKPKEFPASDDEEEKTSNLPPIGGLSLEEQKQPDQGVNPNAFYNPSEPQ